MAPKIRQNHRRPALPRPRRFRPAPWPMDRRAAVAGSAAPDLRQDASRPAETETDTSYGTTAPRETETASRTGERSASLPKIRPGDRRRAPSSWRPSPRPSAPAPREGPQRSERRSRSACLDREHRTPDGDGERHQDHAETIRAGDHQRRTTPAAPPE